MFWIILFILIVCGVFKICWDLLTGAQDAAEIAKDEAKKRNLK